MALPRTSTLPQDARRSVTDGVNTCAIRWQGDVKKLVGREGSSLRIGACRVTSGRGCRRHLCDLHRSPRHHDV
jgi:hypothetical protein